MERNEKKKKKTERKTTKHEELDIISSHFILILCVSCEFKATRAGSVSHSLCCGGCGILLADMFWSDGWCAMKDGTEHQN